MAAIVRFFRSVEAIDNSTERASVLQAAIQAYLDTARHGTGTITVAVDPVPVGPPAATITIRGRVYTAGAAEDLTTGTFLADGGGDVTVIRNSIIDVINADALATVRAARWATDGTGGRLVLQDITSNLADVAITFANLGGIPELTRTGMAAGEGGVVNGKIYTNELTFGGRLYNVAAVVHEIEEASATNQVLVNGGTTAVGFEGFTTGELNTTALARTTNPGYAGALANVDVSVLRFAMDTYVGLDNRVRTACLMVRNPALIPVAGGGGAIVVQSFRSIGSLATLVTNLNAYLDLNNVTYVNDVELHVNRRRDGRVEYTGTIIRAGELGAVAAP